MSLGLFFNLLSISRLNQSLDCVISFTKSFVCLQDQSSRQVIYTGCESRAPPPLQVYSHHHHPQQPKSDSPLVPTIVSPSNPTTKSSLPPSDLPIALRKGIRSTCNPSPHYIALSYHRLSSPFYACLSSISSVTIPKSVRDAIAHDSTIDHLKAHPVAKSYTQIFGLDYGDTFSPMAKMASIRLFIAMAALQKWHLYQLDIKNTFLNGDL